MACTKGDAVGTSKGTVYVIDDDPSVRDALTRLIASAGWSAKSFAAAGEFLDAPRDGAGCLLLDVSMPQMSGPQLHEQLRERGSTLPVIFLTGQGTVSIGVRAMRQGAFDFLEKPVEADTLLPVIERAIAQHARTRVHEQQLGDVRARLAQLSPRERQVMEHVLRGRLNKQIASDLQIGEKTVKVHRGRMMAKMKVHSVAELVHLCDDFGVSPPERSAVA